MELAALCRDLVAIPSESHKEAEIADLIEKLLRTFPELEIQRIGDNVVATSWKGRPQKVIIAGHLDTVPDSGNGIPTFSDGRIAGLGSADMKAGLSVMIGLAERSHNFKTDVTFIFYAREEVASKFSGLREIERTEPGFLQADAAILMEPTSCRIEGGCQGTLRIRITMAGRQAHTARPWVGINAIHRLGPVILKVVEFELSQPVVGGLVYQESLQAVRIEGGVANNVVPDSSSVLINYRFSPEKDIEGALHFLNDYFAGIVIKEMGDKLELDEGVSGALPNLDNPIFAELARISKFTPKAKLGWTDVAFFTANGIPATNFGPGDPLLAHTKEEFVEVSEIQAAYDVLSQLLLVL